MLKKTIQFPLSEQVVAELNEAFADATPLDVLSWLASATGGKVPLVSSFGADSVVLLKMIAEIDPDYPVLFIDTGKHFLDTLHYRDQLKDHFGLSNLHSITPDAESLKEKDPFGALWISNTDACCDLRKTVPLDNAMQSFDGWITGRKRYQTNERSKLEVFEVDKGKLKVNPLASWAAKDVADFVKAHSLPGHPLVPKGFLSIGCAPCTSPVEEGSDPRAGRWKDSEKSECGLHI